MWVGVWVGLGWGGFVMLRMVGRVRERLTRLLGCFKLVDVSKGL